MSPPSLQGKHPALADVLRQYYGASDAYIAAEQRISDIGLAARSRVLMEDSGGDYVPSEDHDPHIDLGFNGGTNEDFADK